MNVIKNVFNFILGLVAVIFTYAVRLMFILMTLVVMLAMAQQTYLFVLELISPTKVLSYTVLIYVGSMALGAGFMVLSALSSLGYADVSKFITRVYSLLFKPTHTEDGTKKRVGKSGAFKNE